MKFSLYIHIPFCNAKCRYCDFFSVPLKDNAEWEGLQENLLNGIISELDERLDKLSPQAIETVFIGGGTPSVIKPELLDRFFIKFEQRISSLTCEDIEFSIEANPESCDKDFLSVLENHRINRLSIGVQSFNRETLSKIGRASYPDNPYQVVSEIRAAWKRKLSLDIITGATPDYEEDLKQVLSLSPEHLSIYALTFEENTPLYDDLINKRIAAPDDDLQTEAIKKSVSLLEDSGFYRYEISNFAEKSGQPSNECRHNLAYWNMGSYIGLGPAAVSSFYYPDRKYRSANTKNINEYISCFVHGEKEADECREIEYLSDFDFMLEHYMMGGRLKAGIEPENFKRRFCELPEYFIPETTGKWRSAGLLSDTGCALNDKGMLVMNRFLSEVYDELKKHKNF